MLIKGFNKHKIIWLDIEVIPQKEKFSELPKGVQEYFYKQFKRKIAAFQQENALQTKEQAIAPFYNQESAFHAEYGRIVCISIGVMREKDQQLYLNSFYGDDEKQIITSFYKMIEKSLFPTDETRFSKICGHYIKNYDMPMILKRGIINGILPPDCINPNGKKPWELNYLLDTWEVWKVGGNTTSGLDGICMTLNVPSPKDGISGADVRNVYYNLKDLNTIVKYCEKDVLATANVSLAMNILPIIDMEKVISKTKF